MNVSLTPQLEELVRSKVASGRYNNASEVVREALRLLEDYDRYEAFRAAVAVGYEQAERGELIPWTPELRAEIQRNVERKAREGHQPNPDVIP
jgi:antitoxin ParD1/3/4